jgi:plastocyanin
MRAVIATILLLSLGAVLAGCGGQRNAAPTVEILSPQDGDVIEGKTVVFEARGEDPDLPAGKRLTFTWDFGDGESAENAGARVEHRYEQPGEYTVSVVAVDDRGAESDAAEIRIAVKNALPEPQATAIPAHGPAPLTVGLDASGSVDPDGTITRYEWDFGDGQGDVGVSVRHEYTEAGVYTVTLTVMDDDGASAQTTLPIRVEPGMGRRPALWEIRMITTPDGMSFFEPAVLLVRPGDTVRWVNATGAHSTTAYSEENGRAPGIPEGAHSWDSGVLTEPGKSFELSIPPDAPEGSYAYFCAQHEATGMVGLLIVGRFTDLDEDFLGRLPGQARGEMELLIEEARQLK